MGYRVSSIASQASKYSIVGGVGYIVDISLFNIFSIVISGLYEFDQPYLAKTIATTIAVAVTYLLNSRWTFKLRNGRPEGMSRILRYGAVSVIGLSFSLIALFISRNVLGFESLLADNLAANFFGVAAAWVFRFFANRKWVFIERS